MRTKPYHETVRRIIIPPSMKMLNFQLKQQLYAELLALSFCFMDSLTCLTE